LVVYDGQQGPVYGAVCGTPVFQPNGTAVFLGIKFDLLYRVTCMP
jgi:hypothetical protein